jgi:5'-AMP-activated protein kinase regulatory gamma subunit
VTYDTPLTSVLELLSTHRISGLPIVDDKGRVVDSYSRGDVLGLAMDRDFTSMDISVREALQRQVRHRATPTCTRDDMMATVFDKLISTRCHRLICLKADDTVDGIITLSDVLYFFLHAHMRQHRRFTPAGAVIDAQGAALPPTLQAPH